MLLRAFRASSSAASCHQTWLHTRALLSRLSRVGGGAVQGLAQCLMSQLAAVQGQRCQRLAHRALCRGAFRHVRVVQEALGGALCSGRRG